MYNTALKTARRLGGKRNITRDSSTEEHARLADPPLATTAVRSEVDK